MIIDSIKNASRYSELHPLFAAAFAYINATDTATLAPGVYEIQGEALKAIVSDKPGKTREESLEKFECHRRYIDIQFCISGKEEIGWKPIQDCSREKTAYDEQKDVQFWEDAPDMYFTLTDQQFVILYPEDVHAPMIGNEAIKKIVFKVQVAA